MALSTTLPMAQRSALVAQRILPALDDDVQHQVGRLRHLPPLVGDAQISVSNRIGFCPAVGGAARSVVSSRMSTISFAGRRRAG
jgi:hypothetical protein